MSRHAAPAPRSRTRRLLTAASVPVVVTALLVAPNALAGGDAEEAASGGTGYFAGCVVASESRDVQLWTRCAPHPGPAGTPAPTATQPSTTTTGPAPTLAPTGSPTATSSATSSTSTTTSVPAPTSEPSTSSTAPVQGRLAWAPPELRDPVTVNVTGAGRVELDDARDYVIDIGGPNSDVVDVGSGQVELSGGDDVVLVGGEIRAQGSTRALYLRSQEDVVHIEGLAITGADEGINIHAERADVRLQNVRVASPSDPLRGSRDGHHADALQTWGGPERLRVDRFEAWTTYQGFMLQPFQFSEAAVAGFDFRNVTLHRPTGSGYLIFNSQSGYPVTTANVLLDYTDGRGVWEPDKAGQDWSGASRGSASPLTGNPGADYTSPGYAS